MQKNILESILKTKRKELAAGSKATDLQSMRTQANLATPARDFYAALTRPCERRVNLIAEIKKASPSAGIICEDFDPVALARAYALAGANALSVLTDETYFQGSLEYLGQVRHAVKLPILRKDFIIDKWQIYQSRAAGADAILLIAAALDKPAMEEFITLTEQLGMSVLVEVHNTDELQAVQSLQAFTQARRLLLGVNNRDLRTFNVDLNTTLQLSKKLHHNVPLVSESGIKTSQDIALLAEANVKAVLVGETLMRSGDIASAVAKLLGPA